jgi:hypothetical protein
MTPRQLGILGIVAGTVGLLNGIRLILIGQPLTPGILTLDTMTEATTAVGAIGGLSALLGFMALRGTGSKPLFRLLGYLPGISYVAMLIAATGMFLDVLRIESESPLVIALLTLGDLLYPLAWLVVGILTIAAKEWRGWRRLVPLWMVAAFVLGAVSAELTKLVGAFHVLEYTATMLLGMAVISSPQPAPAPAAIAASPAH